MISSKNQIIRQKNVDSTSNFLEPKLGNYILTSSKEEVLADINTDVSDELEQINKSIAKLTYRLNQEEHEHEDENGSEDYYENDHFNFASNLNYDLTPSSSSSSSSPSNLLNINNYDKSPRSVNSTSPSSSLNTTQLNSSLNNSKLSTNVIKEKYSKSKNPLNLNKNLILNNSVPITQPIKQRRLANLMRLTHANSFFSRSCPGEELTEIQNSNEDNDNSIKNPSAKPEHHKFLAKSFLSFASKAKLKKNYTEPTNSSSPTTLSTNSVNSVCSDSNQKSISPNRSNTTAKIGSYEVDYEKLARELILPSLDAPLTSFKITQNETQSTTKPPLQTSRTIDSDKPSPKKPMIRSLTQNK